MNRQLLEAHVAATKGTLRSVAADGWCLVRSVALALDKDHKILFSEAVTVLLTSLDHLQLDEEERKTLAEACHKILQANTRVQMHRMWDSALVDQLPTALATVARRPLHICEASDGVVRLTVVPPLALPAPLDGAAAAVDATSAPILLARSFVEIGVDHYDLIDA